MYTPPPSEPIAIVHPQDRHMLCEVTVNGQKRYIILKRRGRNYKDVNTGEVYLKEHVRVLLQRLPEGMS